MSNKNFGEVETIVEELDVDVVVDAEKQVPQHFINVGVIGVGNTGGQNAALAFTEYGIPAAAINSSKRDLETITDDIPKFVIGSGKGSGKDRETGRDYFLDDAMDIIQQEEIVNIVEENDVIAIQFSLGGGQGSAAGPILYNLLQQTYEAEGKIFIMQMVAPSNDDMLVAQEHALDCLAEILKDTPDATYIIYDNSKFPHLNTRELYSKVNHDIAHDLSILRGDYINLTDLDGIDEEELLGVCATPGRMAIGALNNFADHTLDKNLSNTLKNFINEKSSQVVLENDSIITSSALIYTVREEDADLVGNIKTDVQTVFGYHIKDYRNENVTQVKGAENNAYIVLAGLSEPSTRIKQMMDRKKEIERSVIQARSSKNPSLLTSKPREKKADSILSQYATSPKQKSEATSKPSASDILKMYRK